MNYAGVDWAADKHDVRVADETGEELLAATFAHDEKGLRALCRALVRFEGAAGGDRAAGRAAGRAAAGRGVAGAADASQPGRGGPRSVPGRGRQVRPV
jgi:Transposase